MKSPDNEKKGTNGSWKRKALIALCVVLAIILALMVTATVWLEHMLGRIRRPEDQETLSSEDIANILSSEMDPNFTGPTISDNELNLPAGTAPLINADHVINILLVGQDSAGNARTHSDSMILCTIDPAKKTLTMTSFLRDMYMHIPGFGKQRINVSYMVGGFPMLNDTLKENFGVVVDHNIEVDFKAFAKVIDVVGGVDINLTAKEANHLRGQGFNLREGMNHMGGEAALAYARIRSIDADGDFSRTKRQRTVMDSIISKVKNMDVSTMYTLVDSLIPMVVTDMSNSDILGYVAQLGPMLPQLTVVSQRVPADGTYKLTYVQGMSVIIPDFEKNQQLLKDTIGIN